MADAVRDNNTLSEFLRRKKEEGSPTNIDWDAKRDDWVASLESLYQLLTGSLLKSSIDDGTIEVSKAPKQISEEFIGTYSVPELSLKIGNASVVFSPKGVNVIGAAGRIDLRGDRATVTILREKVPDDPTVRWNIVQQRVPRVIRRPLDSASLKWALEHVML